MLSILPFLLHAEQGSQHEYVTFCAVGDVLLDRGIRTRIRRHGVLYPFEKTAELINAYDLALCNLECPLSSRGSPLAKTYTFRGDSAYIEGLHYSGLNIFSLANNHTLDYGREALLDTKTIIEKNGLYTVGADSSRAKAARPRIIHVKDLSFAFLASITFPFEGFTRGEHLPGTVSTDIDDVIQEIATVRDSVDFVIVSFHWGNEFSSYPSKRQKEYAHRIVDSGADLIVGHHPHVLQSIEKYKERFIIYSLGNFIFDQHKQVRRESMIFGCFFEKDSIVSPHIVPLFLEDFRPHIAQDDESVRIVKRVQSLSSEYGVTIKKPDESIVRDTTLRFPYRELH